MTPYPDPEPGRELTLTLPLDSPSLICPLKVLLLVVRLRCRSSAQRDAASCI